MAPQEPEGFFGESLLQSRLKAHMVAYYFPIWAKIIIPETRRRGGKKIGYIDLFAGRGRYDDGTKSTPLLILERAIADPGLRSMLVAIFNDVAGAHTLTLESEIQQLPGIEWLTHKPKVNTSEIGDAIAEAFGKASLIPSLVFIDPWGYKGLSLPLIRAVIKDPFCECIFFFNYNRINMGLTNLAVSHHMEAIFGEERIRSLRERVRDQTSATRERLILETVTAALGDLGGRFVLPFCFRNEDGRTTHYLIFVTKHFKGYEIMKHKMAKHSTGNVEGVPSLEHSLRDVNATALELPLARPIDELQERLLRDYAGQQLTVRQLFEADSVGRCYVLPNYQEALRRLEFNGQIEADPPADRRPKRNGQATMAPKTRISFPSK